MESLRKYCTQRNLTGSATRAESLLSQRQDKHDAEQVLLDLAYPAAEGDPARAADPVRIFLWFYLVLRIYVTKLNASQLWAGVNKYSL